MSLICAMTAEHLSAVAQLETLCFSAPWSEHALELLLGDKGSAVVLLENDRVVAYAGMMHAPDEGQVTNIAVHPDCRRKGYGRAVTEALLSLAEKKGFLEVSLEVRVSNTPAISLYEGLGFLTAGKRKNFYRAPREDALVMIYQIRKDDRL